MAKKKTPKRKSNRHSQVKSLLAGRTLGTSRNAARALLAAAADGAKAVSFVCSNPGCLVGITSGSIHFVFSGTGGASFPIGTDPLFYGVKGPRGQAYSITCGGGKLDFPISGALSPEGTDGGMRQLTVSA